jgi:hypothetical protein
MVGAVRTFASIEVQTILFSLKMDTTEWLGSFYARFKAQVEALEMVNRAAVADQLELAVLFTRGLDSTRAGFARFQQTWRDEEMYADRAGYPQTFDQVFHALPRLAEGSNTTLPCRDRAVF